MIRHTVVFTLKHPAGSAKERAFLDAALVLGAIPGVQKFERLRQVSPKADFAFGFSMEFADERAYQSYNDHADHVALSATAGSPSCFVSRRSTTKRCDP